MEKCNEEGNMVMVIASTNRFETLDPSLMRDGRFFTKIHVGEPDEDGKRKIIGLHLKEVLKEEDRGAICNLVASHTPGLVWDDLVNIANRSIRLAARRGDDHVTMDDVLQALEESRSYFNDKLIAQAYFNDKVIAQEHMQQTMAFGSQN